MSSLLDLTSSTCMTSSLADELRLMMFLSVPALFRRSGIRIDVDRDGYGDSRVGEHVGHFDLN